MRKTRGTEEKGDKGKLSETSSTKGYDAQADLQAMFLGLTKKIKSLVKDYKKMDLKIDNIVTDNKKMNLKMDNIVTDLNTIKKDTKIDKITLIKNIDNVVKDANILKTDKIDVTALNRVADQVIDLVTAKIDERLKGMDPVDEDFTEYAECAN